MGSAKSRARGRFHLARAAAALPAGAWHLEGDLTQAEGKEAALAFLLQSYRFDRYRPAKPASEPTLLKAPKGVDAARLLAMAEGEFLTRDLINTPALDMGPAELEAAFLALADRFDATTQIVRGDDLLAAAPPPARRAFWT
jgi:leucyl aminopeptidase